MGQAWGAFTDGVYLRGLGTFVLIMYLCIYLFIFGGAGSPWLDFPLAAESVGAAL